MHVLDSAWETLKREFESASQQQIKQTRRQLAGELNRLFRRFRQYESEEQWLGALRDGIALAASAFAIFTVSGAELRLRAQQELALSEPLRIDWHSANALRSAIESREPAVTLRRESELGAALASSNAADRVHVFPIANAERVAALVIAIDAPECDPEGVELIAGIASAVLERQRNSTAHMQIAPVAKTASQETAQRPRSLPGWADLNEEQQRAHSRAQRFARVAVAQMQLAHPEACRAGLEQSNLYMFLQSDIDKARESYSKQFMSVPSMVDYLHLELLHSMADGEERNLGADYPGHLV